MLSHALARPLSIQPTPNPTPLLSLFSAPQLASGTTAADHVSRLDPLSLFAVAAIIIFRSPEQPDAISTAGRIHNGPLNALSNGCNLCPDSMRISNTPKRGSLSSRAGYAPISLWRKLCEDAAAQPTRTSHVPFVA